MNLILHERTRSSVEKLKGSLPHALVIDGLSGIGTRTVAEHLAKSMESPRFVIEPKKSIGGQLVVDMNEGNVVIDDIRLLYEQTRAKQPGNHVYVLDTGERSMTIAAQNAFLKLLEEPRPGLHFIIATHHYDQLLPTIISRSQRLSLLPIDATQTIELIDTLRIDDDVKKARLAFVGRGLPALMRRLSENEKLYASRVAIMSDAKIMISGEVYDKAVVVQKYKDDRGASMTLLGDMNHQLKVILSKNADPKLATLIAKYLDAHEKILAGGNIRLQLLNAVL